MQDIVYNNATGLVTFFNNSGTLAYAVQGSSTITSTGISITGKPGPTAAGTLFYITGGAIRRGTINWSAVQSRSTDIFTDDYLVGTPANGTPLHVHGIAALECVSLQDDHGAIRPSYWMITTEHEHPYRFMFPTAINYGAARTISNLALFSAAAKLGNKVFVYSSNCQSGSVQGTYFDTAASAWSMVFTAIPTDLTNSMCEFRVANAFVSSANIYIVGQFRRTENVETDLIYSMILPSSDGKTFTMDRFPIVSDLGYRFLATVGTDHNLYLGNCNRVCYSPVTYIYDETFGLYVNIPDTKIVRFSDQGARNASMEIADGNESLMFHSYMKVGSRAKVDVCYAVSGGTEYVPYGVYIIDTIDEHIADGVRGITLNLVNESEWKLTGLTSAYYTEIFSKSSIFDPMTEDSGNLYVAPLVANVNTSLMVDFWRHDAFSSSEWSVTGISMEDGGGVNYYETAAAAHRLGIKTKDLKSYLSLKEYPKITGTSLTVKIYGWSRPQEEGQDWNDRIQIALFLKDANMNDIDPAAAPAGDPEDESLWTARWPQTWPTTRSGQYPIEVEFTGLTAGTYITSIGVIVWNKTHGTAFNIARIEIASGIETPGSYDDSNTPWGHFEGRKGMEIPGYGRPYVMFAQKPFNAWNFHIMARLENSVLEGVTNYPAAVGLVALAEDGRNFICARYNRPTSSIQIVKVRNGLETIVAEQASPANADRIDMMFNHRDGHFEVYAKLITTVVWTLAMSYDWDGAEGWMYTSTTVAAKTGVYGYMSSPGFKICSLNLGEDETHKNADGIAILPGESVAGFPTTGTIRIGDSIYKYTGVVDPPAAIHGPYQYRQAARYSPPYGDGYGLECRDFDWTASDTAFNGKFCALDDGGAYIISGSDWTTFVMNGGSQQWLRNRARHYSTNSMIAEGYHGLQNRVWITGGLTGVTAVSNPKSHAYGERATLSLTGRIACHFFAGAGGEDDTTVADLIDRISRLSGAQAEFPGDVVMENVPAGNTLVKLARYAESIDIRFDTTGSTAWTLATQVNGSETGWYPSTDTGMEISLVVEGGGNYTLNFVSTPSDTLMHAYEFTAETAAHSYRIIIHDSYINIYMDGRWLHSIFFNKLVYPVLNSIYLDSAVEIPYIRLVELSDWREAVYIDLETDGRSALASVIQERPVEIAYKSNGAVEYWYERTPEQIVQTIEPRSHSWQNVTPRDCASDAIVYSAEKVQAIQYQPYARAYGFSTKVFRLPNLYLGALRAAKILLERLFERNIIHRITTRPDVRVEVGDLLLLDYTTTSTGTQVQKNIIVEGYGIDISGPGDSSMVIQGREDL